MDGKSIQTATGRACVIQLLDGKWNDPAVKYVLFQCEGFDIYYFGWNPNGKVVWSDTVTTLFSTVDNHNQLQALETPDGTYWWAVESAT